jgi:hypothetical protein
LSAAALDGLLGPEDIDLGEPSRFYPAAYEAGTIAAKAYAVRELPAESVLRADLGRFLALYDSCVDLNDELRAKDPDAIHTTAGAVRTRQPVRPRPPAEPGSGGVRWGRTTGTRPPRWPAVSPQPPRSA